jgi:carboxypeptidase PM20D1
LPKTDAGIRTTVAPTLLQAGAKENVLPQEATATINLRLLPGDTVAAVVERLRSVVAEPRVQVEVACVHSEPSPVSAVDSHAFRLLRRTILQTAGPAVTVAPYLVVGATDSRHFTGLTANVYRFLFLRLAGADLKRIHGTDERISIGNYEEMIGFYYRLLKNVEGPETVDREP